MSDGTATSAGLAAGALDRREFLARAGALGLAGALWQVPGLLRVHGWYDAAYAQDPDLVRDTLNGLVAWVWPGDDDYSIAQGDSEDGAGAMASDTTTLLIEALDNFLPQPHVAGVVEGETAQLSGAIANLLNVVALTVNPVAAGGQFPSPFARLSRAEKTQVFEFLETNSGAPDADLPQPFTRASGNFEFVAGILPGFVAFLSFTEWHTYDPASRVLTGQPVGWAHSGYQGGRVVPVEGWDELRGYWGGRRAADP